jgi:hypothetical protein
MKTLAGALGLSGILLFAGAGQANEFDLDLDDARQGPAIRIGFQMALRTGYSLPFGKANAEDGGEMSNVTGGQVPLLVDIGGKVVPHLFLGGYIGFAAGPAAGNADDECDRANYDCYTTSLRAGLEGHFQLLPHSTVNPWIGYGIGYEQLTLKQSGDGGGSVTNGGPEYARLMAGFDWRMSRGFGLGPFADLSIAKYTRFKDDSPGEENDQGNIAKASLHQWLTVGARVVFFP